ncbi:uncharacterized protein LOC126845117 [Adelges cooleyi]|uniref:uncharacterized protein LOC126845117 n=1 Tax=Adelges cooleyi TaxID=133065 RepID=UPI00218079C0|nr:uncharacterized protein LOC126845117 [Adelges cooleyi]
MKLFGILVSFICVNVLAGELITDYIRTVENTNTQIQNSAENLEELITHLIDTNDDTPGDIIEEMILWFTVPELADTSTSGRIKRSIRVQVDFQKTIFKTIGTPMPADTTKSIETLKLPDLGRTRRGLTGNAIINVLTKKLAETINTVEYALSLQRSCNLIAMWISLITSKKMDCTIDSNYKYCKVLDDNNNYVKYMSLENGYYQVDKKGNQIGELIVQLRDKSSFPRFEK